MANAFNPKLTAEIHQVIRRLSNRIINSHRCDVTPDDLFEVYVRPGDREVLTRVFEIVQLDSTTSRIAHNVAAEGGDVGVQIYVDFNKVQKKWLVPKYARHGMIKDADPEIMAKVKKWVDRRVALGVECGMVMALFNELNWRCSVGSLKFYMPSIADFLDMIEDQPKVTAKREKLLTARVPALEPIPIEMRTVLDGVKATVARARLMDKKSEERPDGVVRITLSSAARQTPWGTSLNVF